MFIFHWKNFGIIHWTPTGSHIPDVTEAAISIWSLDELQSVERNLILYTNRRKLRKTMNTWFRRRLIFMVVVVMHPHRVHFGTHVIAVWTHVVSPSIIDRHSSNWLDRLQMQLNVRYIFNLHKRPTARNFLHLRLSNSPPNYSFTSFAFLEGLSVKIVAVMRTLNLDLFTRFRSIDFCRDNYEGAAKKVSLIRECRLISINKLLVHSMTSLFLESRYLYLRYRIQAFSVQ